MPAATTAPALSNRLRRPMTYSMAVTPAAGLPCRSRSFHPVGSGSVAAPLQRRAAFDAVAAARTCAAAGARLAPRAGMAPAMRFVVAGSQVVVATHALFV